MPPDRLVATALVGHPWPWGSGLPPAMGWRIGGQGHPAAAADAADEHGGKVGMPADLLAGCSGTEWNPKGPVALVTDYRCCSEGMWRDRMDPDGRPLSLLITQRSRVQIPPPPPRLTSTFGASPPSQKDSRTDCCQSFVSGGPGLRYGPFCWGGTVQDQAGHRVGGRRVHAGDDVAVDVQGDGDGGVAQALADHLGRDARGQRGGGVAVTHVVQPDRRQ